MNPKFFFKHLNPTPTEVETYGMCDRSWCYNRIHWEDHPNFKLVGRKTSHMKLSRYQLGGGWMMTNHSKHFNNLVYVYSPWNVSGKPNLESNFGTLSNI